MRLSDAFDAFLRHLEHERHASPLTLVGYKGDFYQYLAWLDNTLALERARGTRPPVTRPNDLAHFTAERIRAWQASLSIDRRLHPSTVRRKLHALASFARWLVRTGAIGRSPMATVTLPTPRKRAKVGMPWEVWQRVLALPLPPREATIRGVLAYAGLRRAEVLAMMPSDLRLGDLRPALLVHGKGSKERVVPVPAPLKALLVDYALRTLRTGRELLFQTTAGGAIHPSTLTAWVKAWGKAAGWPALHPHLFRDSYASGLLAAGVSIRTVQQWLGHESLATTEHYLNSLQAGPDLAVLDGWAGSSINVAVSRRPEAPTTEESDTYEGMI